MSGRVTTPFMAGSFMTEEEEEFGLLVGNFYLLSRRMEEAGKIRMEEEEWWKRLNNYSLMEVQLLQVRGGDAVNFVAELDGYWKWMKEVAPVRVFTNGLKPEGMAELLVRGVGGFRVELGLPLIQFTEGQLEKWKGKVDKVEEANWYVDRIKEAVKLMAGLEYSIVICKDLERWTPEEREETMVGLKDVVVFSDKHVYKGGRRI